MKKKFSTSFPAIYRCFSGQRANFHTVLPAPICSGRLTRLGRDVHFSTVFLWKSVISCGKAVIFLLLSPTFPPAFPTRHERGCGARHGAQRKENLCPCTDKDRDSLSSSRSEERTPAAPCSHGSQEVKNKKGAMRNAWYCVTVATSF